MKLNIEKRQNLTSKSSLAITISGFLAKILAAIYRVPYQNLVGDRGFYAYQQVYPILAIISALSLTAFPNVIASIYQKSKKTDLYLLFKFQILSSFILASILLLANQSLARLIGSIQLAPSIILTAFVLLTIPFMSFYRGLAQAHGDMIPTAVSQVLEQSVRVFIIILAALAYYLFDWDVYFTANVAASGNLLASLAILAYFVLKSPTSLLFLFKKHKTSFKNLRQIGWASTVFIFFTIYLLLFQFIDALFVKQSLQSSGITSIQAEITKGIYDRGQPLLQFGLIFSTAFFTTHLPKLSKSYHQKEANYEEDSQTFFDFITYLNLTLTAGFMLILPAMNMVLFEDKKGSAALEVYLLMILLASLIQYCHQKHFIENHQKRSFIILVSGLILKLFLTPILTYYFGIIGSSLSGVIPLLIIFLLYLKVSGVRMTSLKNIRYFLALSLMMVFVGISQGFLPQKERLDSLLAIFISIGLGLLVFILSSVKLRAFSQNLWSYLPFKQKK
ncbi:oligosaccharide flippase family protein [Streptococcus hongkongensis]|nr:polysaccharide biosynthesis protein [Streptococcus uberis]